MSEDRKEHDKYEEQVTNAQESQEALSGEGNAYCVEEEGAFSALGHGQSETASPMASLDTQHLESPAAHGLTAMRQFESHSPLPPQVEEAMASCCDVEARQQALKHYAAFCRSVAATTTDTAQKYSLGWQAWYCVECIDRLETSVSETSSDQSGSEQNESLSASRSRSSSPPSSGPSSSPTDDYEPSTERPLTFAGRGHKRKVSDHRLRTHLGGKSQGDHVTAYIAILEAVAASASGKPRDAIAALNKFVARLRIEGFVARGLTSVYPEGHRVEIIDGMWQKGFEKEDCQLVSVALADYKANDQRAQVANCIQDSLGLIQGHGRTTHFSRGRKKAQGAGADEKRAARVLYTLDFFRSLEEQEEIPQDTLDALCVNLSSRVDGETEREHILRYGLNALDYPVAALEKCVEEAALDPTVGTDKLKAELQQIINISGPIDIIVAHVGMLFDYQHKLFFDLRKAIPDVKDKEESRSREYKLKNFKNLFSEEHEQINDTSMLFTVEVIRQDVNQLIEAINSHFVVMQAAYPKLFENPDSIIEIKRRFIEQEVLEESGWCNCLFDSQPLTCDKLLEMLAALGGRSAEVSATSDTSFTCVFNG